jgi:antitoxin component YwqK of YwqJK toxin-antitoxin module
MKTLVAIILFSFLSCAIHAQNNKSVDISFEALPYGKYHIKGKVENDKENGDWFWYKENQELYFKVNYLNGEISSVVCYDHSDTDTVRFRYKGMVNHGQQGLFISEWNKNITKQKAEMEFNTINSLIGIYGQHYYDNGQIKRFFNSLTGDEIKYFRNGIVESKGKLINGKRDGIWQEYHKNGNLANKGTFINGLPKGEFIEYDETGTVTKKMNY